MYPDRFSAGRIFAIVLVVLAATAARGFAASSFSIGGKLLGLDTGATVTLLDNNVDSLQLKSNGNFSFKTKLASKAKYDVVVSVEPSGELCTVTHGLGTVAATNITTVLVTCKKAYSVGGSVSGLKPGDSVTLLDNLKDSLTVGKNASFTFKTKIAAGLPYKVTVGTQPAGEKCSIVNASGTITTKAVTNVTVTCVVVPTHSVGGTLSGVIKVGESVVLLDNGGDPLTVSKLGAFTFKTQLTQGSKYNVTVGTQPAGELCKVGPGAAGLVGSANITTIKVNCVDVYTIGGRVKGLNTGESVTLLDNLKDSVTVSANGSFKFPTALPTGSRYSVTIKTQPTGEKCTLGGATGAVGTSNVSTVAVNCASTVTHTIGGTVTGLLASHSVTLLDNAGNALTVPANGSFKFTTPLTSGARYDVTVGTQPAGEDCVVSRGIGIVGTTNVTDIAVTCSASGTFSIGGTVSGLTSGQSVTLLDNGGDSLQVKANGGFTFVTKLASGSNYNVTVGTQPTAETCSLLGNTGTVGTKNVTGVTVTCVPSPTYSIGVNVTGLTTGQSVTLLDNLTDSLPVSANGSFNFPKKLLAGAAYSVTVGTQPTAETCNVTGGTGNVGNASVVGIAVACTPNPTYTIGGNITGLSTGQTVTLLDNLGDSLPINGTGSSQPFTFKTALLSGANYSVTVGTQPAAETCNVTSGSGKVAGANITNVAVACSAGITYTVGGNVTGLHSGQSVTLLDNGGDSLAINGTGSSQPFTFKTALASGANYAVTVGTQPAGEFCTVTSGSGKIAAANITNVAVACTPNPYSIGGNVTGLASGQSVTLLDNGGDSLPISGTGSTQSFTFVTQVDSGSTYAVTVGTQPDAENCTVTSGSGTVGSANVTNVAVACTPIATYSIGGNVSGLTSGAKLGLSDNVTDTLTGTGTSASSVAFTFATKLASGASYSVAITAQPVGETCTITTGTGSGKVGSANVTSVAITCTASSGGGSGYWIPYAETLLTPGGQSGLYVLASDKLESTPTPSLQTITTDAVTILGLGFQVSLNGGIATAQPQSLMYADTTPSTSPTPGVTTLHGISLSDTSTVPTPIQISSFSITAPNQVCEGAGSFPFTAETDVTQSQSLFAIFEYGTSAQCMAGTGTIVLVNYQDKASAAPSTITTLKTTRMDAIYQDYKLAGLIHFNSTTSSLDKYAASDTSFASPTHLITSLLDAQDIATGGNIVNAGTGEVFYETTTTVPSTNALYRIDGSTFAVTQIQNLGQGFLGSTTQDGTNLYYIDLTNGGTVAAPTTTAAIYQVALTGGTPKLLYTNTYGSSGVSPLTGYTLIGTNGSVLAFEYYTDPISDAGELKATGTLYTTPLGVTTTTPTVIGGPYPAGTIPQGPFLAAPSGSGLSGNILFTTLRTAAASNNPVLPTILYSAASIPLDGSTAPKPIANSTYSGLAELSTQPIFGVLQVTGITDTDGATGGGTLNVVDVATLADTPITKAGGGDYVYPVGFSGGLFLVDYGNVAPGLLDNAIGFETGTYTSLQETPLAIDLSKNFLWVGTPLTNTEILPY